MTLTKCPALMAMIVLAAAVPIRAQHVSGTVTGLHGKPAVGATVELNSNTGCLGAVVTDADGGFSYDGRVPIDHLVVRFEAVQLPPMYAVNGKQDLALSLVGVSHFTIRGHVVGPSGEPAKAVDVLARDAFGRSLGVVTTDARGAYLLHSNQAIEDVLVDPFGWSHTSAGPFRVSRGLAIDLRLVQDQYSELIGRVLDAHGKPVAQARVVARGSQRGRTTIVGHTWTRADGTFSLWSNRPVTQLSAKYSTTRLRHRGGWAQGQPIVLDERQDLLVLVGGKVLDADGKRVARALVYACPEARIAKGMRALTRANGSGEFYVQVRIGTAFLVAEDPAGQQCGATVGPWTRSNIELRPTK